MLPMRILLGVIAGSLLAVSMPSDYCPQPPWCSGDRSRMSPGERTVCSDEILGIEENLLSSVYRHLEFYASIDVEELRREQRAWLRIRNRLADRDDLMLLYLQRIEVLARRLAEARRQAP